MPHLAAEIAAQPAAWRQAAALSAKVASSLPARGERVAFVGCGTSLYMAQAIARLREQVGQGESDAFAASEFPLARRYARVVAITRSGTTTEVLRLLHALRDSSARTVAITEDSGSEAAQLAGEAIVLPFAAERSTVQTVFATTTLMLLRAHLGDDVAALADAAQAGVRAPGIDELVASDQLTFVGQGWAEGIANEAALKVREAAQAWTESYAAMEYRHGPVSIAARGRTFWCLGPAPGELLEEVAQTGATVVHHDEDPAVSLVRVQRLAAAMAQARGLDPDHPRNLARSVILAS